jgi:hypothetical protein
VAKAEENTYGPYPNRNSLLLSSWYWSHGAQKSKESFRKLLDVVGDPDFRPDDVRHTRWRKIDAKLGSNEFEEGEVGEEEGAAWLREDAGWKKTPINISVPFHSKSTTPGPQNYFVGHLHHRSLVSVIREKLANPHDTKNFHYEPFELFWRASDVSANVRVHGELYSSPDFINAHRQLQESPREPSCNLPRSIAALMFWSDATHLTNFGTAKLWPCYLFFGNESKYRRCKPTHNLCNHVAYFQVVRRRLQSLVPFLTLLQLPDAFQDFASERFGGKRPSKAFMTHCRREVLHAQWNILLDDDFIAAYKHGIVVYCCDDIARRFYPRFFTYSGDYKEKCVVSFRKFIICSDKA